MSSDKIDSWLQEIDTVVTRWGDPSAKDRAIRTYLEKHPERKSSE